MRELRERVAEERWQAANQYARNYVLRRLIDEAGRLEKDQNKLSDQRAEACHAAIMLLSRLKR